MLLAQGGSRLYILPPHYASKRTINDTTFSLGGKGGEAKENTLPVLRVSYTVLFLTLNILRLSAISQMGHKPLIWRPALMPTAGSMQ